ncbi:lipoprotein signal peptidase [Barnesiella sp. CU968]|jgi:signal peptidase II|uniref:lipoprotein signal peptidase n=1 Tax=Barnesiella sp. CU968 TaxID=2780099 RepID=UPI00195EAC86|nr:lipoprotein signal peptidase [Barnesiella sp. CU968]MBJ2198664.1 lipoprotein signal peptidase [Muribaculaceae bacterium]MCI9030134.1 lipoprotein signal peptidase [Muribaculaceae bacterium]
MTDQEIRKPLDKISKSSGISAGWLALIIAFVVIIADQTLKIWIKTNFYIGEDYEIFRWFHIKFIENNGMAFGLELWNKLVLTFGRIIAVALFVWFIIKVKDIKGIRKGFIVAVALIAAGAAGNIFDCVFYGKIFNNPMPPQVAEIFPADGGYAGWFEGKVVDMLYFPFFDFYWPEWMPVVGGSYYEFFAYIFNIADSSICIGVALLILFYSKDASVAFNAIGGDSAKTESEAK